MEQARDVDGRESSKSGRGYLPRVGLRCPWGS
ncbi:hypothetical protein COLO4_22035 [Corchorus olitorius]|uniref:Uncharacterized protein n=1 Tax=Corchorus olitorius TaxID=93759 RepID=A0A1R3IPB2_9ROSI|nr:hypothetical protein COLO4_22035 [Corchorus olitorius]